MAHNVRLLCKDRRGKMETKPWLPSSGYLSKTTFLHLQTPASVAVQGSGTLPSGRRLTAAKCPVRATYCLWWLLGLVSLGHNRHQWQARSLGLLWPWCTRHSHASTPRGDRRARAGVPHMPVSCCYNLCVNVQIETMVWSPALSPLAKTIFTHTPVNSW